MAWNEPGNGDKDPWGKKGNDAPPDLDEVLRNFQNKLGALFGGKGGDSSSNSNGGGNLLNNIGLIVIIAVVVWLLSGIYIVEQAERGVVLRFGQYVETTEPGPHWHLPYPIEKAKIVNVDQIRRATLGENKSESLMLTKDENIIDLKISVQYKIKNAEQYLFNVRDPDDVLRQVMRSAVRETVGQSNMDFILTQGRDDITIKTEESLQKMLDNHKTGLLVTGVNMQNVQAPDQVQAAFLDAVKAREDEVRQKNQAEAYSNDILPRARGKAFRILQAAQGYKSEVVAAATGTTSRFLQVMAAYEKAPKITQERLYLDTMESVYKHTPKVMMDVPSGSNNVFYLPLDRLGNKSSTGASSESTSSSAPPDIAYPSNGGGR